MPDLLYDRARHGPGGRKGGSLLVHRPEERLAGGVDERHGVEIDADGAGFAGGREPSPAGPHVVDPPSSDSSRELDGRSAGPCDDVDSKHRTFTGARLIPR